MAVSQEEKWYPTILRVIYLYLLAFSSILGHYASDEVKEKLAFLSEEKTTLQSLWEERRIMYEQCMDYQLFYRGMIDTYILFYILQGVPGQIGRN